MTQPVRVLMLEHNPLEARLATAKIEMAGLAPCTTRIVSRPEFEAALNEDREYDLILVDYACPEFDSLTAMKIARRHAPHTPFMFVPTAIEALASNPADNSTTDGASTHDFERTAPGIKLAFDSSVGDYYQSGNRQPTAGITRFRELADALPLLVWMTNADGTVVYENHRARQYTGHLAYRQAPAGLHVAHPDDSQQLKTRWQEAVAREEEFAHQCRLRRNHDGQYHWHMLRFIPVERDGAHTGAWLETAVNVEEQVQREDALRVSQAMLHRLNETLEQRVQERTEAYRRLSGRLLLIQDVERRKIARELHETLGQYLAGLKISLDLIQSGGDLMTADRRAELLAQSVETLDRCIRETRMTSYLLHPPMLEEAGFAHAARWYVDGFKDRTRIDVSLIIPADMERLPSEVESAFFRVLQESLTNVQRHSGTRAVDISFSIEDREARLEVIDYGRGISREQLELFRQGLSKQGLGLTGMEERVKELGGWLQINSDSRRTQVRAGIPLQWPEHLDVS